MGNHRAALPELWRGAGLVRSGDRTGSAHDLDGERCQGAGQKPLALDCVHAGGRILRATTLFAYPQEPEALAGVRGHSRRTQPTNTADEHSRFSRSR